MYHILLIEEYIILRTGIKALIDAQPELKLFAEATSVQEALTIKPLESIDLIITDIKSDHQRTKNDIEHLLASFPKAKILVFTPSENEDGALASLGAGAAGFLFKEASGEALIQAVNQLFVSTTSAEVSTATTSA
jgi:DNA-binding NarL/FixJ family response regulator